MTNLGIWCVGQRQRSWRDNQSLSSNPLRGKQEAQRSRHQKHMEVDDTLRGGYPKDWGCGEGQAVVATYKSCGFRQGRPARRLHQVGCMQQSIGPEQGGNRWLCREG